MTDFRPKGRAEAFRSILAGLDRTRRRLRLLALARGGLQTAVVLLVLGPAVFLVDNWFHLSTPLRVGCLGLIVVGAAAAFGWAGRVMFRRWNYNQLAARIEARMPELDNRLINAVQLGADERSYGKGPLVQAVIDEAAGQIRTRPLDRTLDIGPLKRTLVTGLALGVLALPYPLLMPEHFRNAAARILRPTSPIEPLTATRLEVAPGAATITKGEDLTITAAPSGKLPSRARLFVEQNGERPTLTMDFNGSVFSHTLRGVARPLRYRVRANDYTSRWFEVRVIERPRIKRLAIRYDYPAYTALEPSTVDPAEGRISALRGTRVTMRAGTNKTLESAGIQFESSGRQPVAISKIDGTPGNNLVYHFKLLENDAYRWVLVDEAGRTNEPATRYPIKATPDQPPKAAITSPRGSVEVEHGQSVDILYLGSDDYGVAESALVVSEKGIEGSETLMETKHDPPPKRFNEGYVLETEGYEVGTELRVRVAISDNNPMVTGSARSEPLEIKIVAPAEPQREASEALKGILRELIKLAERQRDNRREATYWRAELAAQQMTAKRRTASLKTILLDQSTLRVDAKALTDHTAKDPVWAKTRAALEELADGPMREAVVKLKAMAGETPDEALREPMSEAIELQGAILRRLQQLIGRLVRAAPELREQLREELDKLREPSEAPDSLADLHAGTLKFIDDQKGLIRTLQEMERIDPMDFTTTQTRQVENLAQIEEEWTEYFKDADEWLRKAPMVEGTESGLRDELIEIYSEIELLPEELRHDPVTIEVSVDQVGLELAEELVHDLEKWLPEEPDYRKWVMEQPPEDYEVPLAELPDELEDMMGELIETEATMMENIEDVTSNWADSIDAGAGWGVADGPISNYSAKGVTGNILPNDMDIAGRSGEGRTGRSLGEMVESIATGKEGRDTPTRMTSDPMGDGVVEDLSTEQVKGVTGGGKVAGTTGWGLVSPNAPDQPLYASKMAGVQADLQLKAIRLHERLMRTGLPTRHLERSIGRMVRMQRTIQQGHYDNLADMGAVVLEDLKDQRRLLREQFKLKRLEQRGGERFRHEVRGISPEQFPKAYRALLSAYFESLAMEARGRSTAE